MKRIIILLAVLGLIIPVVYAQNVPKEKLTKKQREKLFNIATEAFRKYAPSYYRDDLELRVVYGKRGEESRLRFPYLNLKDEDYDRMIYLVAFGYYGAQKEGDDNVYGGSVLIFGDTGKVIAVKYGYIASNFVIVDEEEEERTGTHPVAPPTKYPNPHPLKQ